MISYIDIRLMDIDKDNMVSDKRIGNLMTLVHRAAQGRQFALGFPQYREGERRTLGSFLRVYSFDSADAIKAIFANQRLSMFLLDWCEVQPIKQLSDMEIKGWVRYRKSSIAKKMSASHCRRAERRFNEGRRKTPISITTSRASAVANGLPRFYHYSKTSDMEAPIFIAKEKTDGIGEIKFDSFGLALAGSKGVPILNGDLP